MPKYKDGLSPKQRKFVQNYIKTGNGREAVEQAGYNTANPGVAYNIAYENVRKPEVQGLLAQHLLKYELKTEDVVKVLVERLNSPDDVIALKAAELAGKHLRMFTDKQDTNQITERVKDISWSMLCPHCGKSYDEQEKVQDIVIK